MIKHHVTKYRTDGEQRVASWLQLNLFNHQYCLSIKELSMNQKTTK